MPIRLKPRRILILTLTLIFCIVLFFSFHSSSSSSSSEELAEKPVHASEAKGVPVAAAERTEKAQSSASVVGDTKEGVISVSGDVETVNHEVAKEGAAVVPKRPATPVPDPETAQVLWISKLDSDEVARGFMQENVNFIVPLEKYLHIGWRPGGTQEALDKNAVYLALPPDDRVVLDEAFTRGVELYNGLANKERKIITVLSEQPFHYDSRFDEDGGRLDGSRYKIGRAMFETTWIPNGWAHNINTYLDEVWVPSHFAKNVFEEAGVKTTISIIREGFDQRLYKELLSPEARRTTRSALFGNCRQSDLIYFMVGKSEKRKGIEILIQAFGEEFRSGETGVCLYMRSSLTGPQKNSLRKYPQVRFGAMKPVSDEQLAAAYQSADVFVLATHGEGWGRPVMEALAAGTPVIVPFWSGMTEFVDPECPLTLQVNRFEQAFKGQPWFIGGKANAEKHKWATIKVPDLRAKLRWAEEHRDELATLGAEGRERMMAGFTREDIAKDAVERLQDIWAAIRR